MECPNCGKQTPEEDAFCGKCGQLLKASLREIVQTELQSQLSANYKDQKLLTIETAESIVERLEKWGKWLSLAIGIAVAIFLAALAVFGITTFQEGKNRIDAAAKVGEKRITDAADADIANMDQRINSLTASVEGQIGSLKQQGDSLQSRVEHAEKAIQHLVDGGQTLAQQESALNFMEQTSFAKVTKYAEMLATGAAGRKANEAELADVPIGQQRSPLHLQAVEKVVAFQGKTFVENKETIVVGFR